MRKVADRTTAYAKLIISGKRICGKAEYQACKRHLDDMADKNCEYVFDVKEAEKHIDIANQLTIGEGVEAKKLTMRGFQNFIIGSLCGWRKKRSKTLRYREAYIQVARQNGKSFLAGGFCNDRATFSDYKRGRIFCTATKQDQANIVWDEVDKFIESDSDLMNLYKIRKYDRTITSLVTGTIIKAIGRDTKTADGFRSILAIVDEYHAHPTNQMYKLMQDGQLAVDNALTLAITTAGFNLNGPCYEHYRFCKQVLAGNIKKDSLFVYIAELDKDDDASLQEAFEQMMRKQSSVKTLYEDINLLAARAKAILSDKAGVGWVGENHTASAVPVFAVGVGAERFTGWMDNSEIAPRIYQATR